MRCRIGFPIDDMGQPLANPLLLDPVHPLTQFIEMGLVIGLHLRPARLPYALRADQVLGCHRERVTILRIDQQAALQFIADILGMAHLQAVFFVGMTSIRNSNGSAN